MPKHNDPYYEKSVDPHIIIPDMIEEYGFFTVKFSPIANDPTCKISVGSLDFPDLTIDDLKAIINNIESP